MSQFIEMFGDPMVNDKQWSEYSCISEITQIVLGSTPNSKEPSYWDGDIRWITPAEMTDQSYYIFDTVRHITDEGRKAANLTMLPEGTVLFSTRAPIGKVAIVGKEMCCNQGFKNFICSEKLNNVFLYYTLKLKKDYLCSLGTGTTFKELSKRTVESLKIAVPPIELQNQFETIYNQADKSGFGGFKSQFIEMFGDTPQKKIAEVCEVRGGSTPTRTSKEFWDNGTVSWFTVEDIYERGRYINETKQHITELATKKCFVYPIDTVLICCTASVGEYAITKKEMASNQQFNGMMIKDKTELHPEYLLYVASTLKEVLLRQAGKTTINFVSRSKLESIEIPVPSYSDQLRFVSIYHQADKSGFELRKSIDAIDAVIKSLINS